MVGNGLHNSPVMLVSVTHLLSFDAIIQTETVTAAGIISSSVVLRE